MFTLRRQQGCSGSNKELLGKKKITELLETCPKIILTQSSKQAKPHLPLQHDQIILSWTYPKLLLRAVQFKFY